MKINQKQFGISICVIVLALANIQMQPVFASEEQDNPVSSTQATGVLESFLVLLSEERFEAAYALVAPSSKANGDPIAYHTPLDFESFVKEITSPAKFKNYEIKNSRWETAERFRLTITLDNWDTDETLIVYEDGAWYVADPIHIIR